MSRMEQKFERDERPLQTLGLQPNHYALFLGRFSPEKNCHLLIEAFEQVDTSMKLVLAGGSSHTDEYVSSLRMHESARIRFLPWLSGRVLEEVLVNAALFVLPSDMEGMSLALLDAMGAGICVLASDIPENIETIGNAGFTFRRGDTEDLRSMLHRLLGDENLRRNAGRRARERVRQNYLWESVTAEMIRVYESMVARPRRMPAAEARALGKAA